MVCPLLVFHPVVLLLSLLAVYDSTRILSLRDSLEVPKYQLAPRIIEVLEK
jgi:hypothetical protein